jgi:hypothetical protein
MQWVTIQHVAINTLEQSLITLFGGNRLRETCSLSEVAASDYEETGHIRMYPRHHSKTVFCLYLYIIVLKFVSMSK